MKRAEPLDQEFKFLTANKKRVISTLVWLLQLFYHTFYLSSTFTGWNP